MKDREITRFWLSQFEENNIFHSKKEETEIKALLLIRQSCEHQQTTLKRTTRKEQ